MIRLKIAVRDPTKIPGERLVAMRRKLYWISFKVEGAVVQEEDNGDDDHKNEDSFDDSAFREGKEDNNDMDTDKAGNIQKKSTKDKSTDKSGECSKSKGSKTVPLWTSMFKENELEDLFPDRRRDFNRFNLLQEMDLVASDDEELMDSDQEVEDSEPQVLPEHIVKRFKNDKSEDVSLDMVTRDLSRLETEK